MYPRFAFALLFSVCAFGLGIAIPAFPEQKCGSNAEFLSCGSACVPDCANPEPPKFCTLQCVIGCFCKEGFLKNAKSECVRPHECEARTHEVPEALVIPQCPANEEFQSCGSACVASCANPHPSPVCTKNCVIGCFCKQGHLRNSHGVCVPANQCEAPETSMFFAYPPEVSQCKENEIFMPCGSACAPTCAKPHPGPICTLQCVIGCFCKPGYLKNEHGVCVPAETCGVPAAEAIAMPPASCGENEEYRQCKGCDGTCARPLVPCPRICIPGCACKQGHLRTGANGKCILAEQCPHVEPLAAMMMPPVQQCGENEEFRQCKGCDGTCANPNPLCPRNCVPGCACKQGHLRTGANGKCILAEQCPHVEPLAAMMLPPVQQCGENEEFKMCRGCDGTCDNPNPICPRNCVPGCACKQGHFRNPNNKCVLAEKCPPMPVQAMSQQLPQCGENEEFHSCGTACPATCANPHPSPICTKNCVIGCFCKPGYLKNNKGVCVAAANCLAEPVALFASAVQPEGQCASDREFFHECGEQLDCLSSCNTPPAFLIHGEPQMPKKCLERKCTPGCVCQRPYVRHADGRCVETQECERFNPFTTTPSH